jgi:peptide/nickel transport system substrate-binding protein/oligopeptide transport system substrate-binding protein
LDPAVVVDVAEGEICTQVFQGLVRFSPEGEIIPDLAKAWVIGRDGRRYVFRLDQRMRFSNGRGVVASDVVYSFERVLVPDSASPRKWALDRIRGAKEFAEGERDSIAGLTAPNDSTLIIELDEPFKPFLSMLALPAAMVVPREELVGGGAGRAFAVFMGLPVGSGPWRIEAWERGDFITLAFNPFYPRKPDGIQKINYRIIPEAFTRVAEFTSGALDILELPTPELDRFLTDERYSPGVQSRSELRVYYIGLNNTREPFSEVKVRRALNMAVDVDKIIQTLAMGQGVRAGGAIPPGLKGYAERERYVYDIETAKRVLAEAGYPDGFTMEIWQRESPEGTRVLEAVQGYLKRVGVEVTLVRREWSAFKEAVSKGRVDAFFLDWFADYPDAENFIYPLFHSHNAGGGGNRSFFKDEYIDGLMEAASRTTNEYECIELYSRIDSLVYERAPWIYLYFPKTHHAVSERLSGYQLPSLYLGNDYTSVHKKQN